MIAGCVNADIEHCIFEHWLNEKEMVVSLEIGKFPSWSVEIIIDNFNACYDIKDPLSEKPTWHLFINVSKDTLS